MKNVLVLGAGLVAKPLVAYLLDQPDFHVKVASRTVSKAKALIGNHPRGEARAWNISDGSELKNLVSSADLAISLLPAAYHVIVAELCVELRKQMVTTSYVSDKMRALDGRARDASVLILNEIGLDPGIDHMSAMKIIHTVQNRGGKIVSFRSFCGGLPAPEANTNPFGYKFSWSPRGVVLAGKNSARYLKDGREVVVPGDQLFAHYSIYTIEGLGEFEAYPNRDSIPYIQLYGLSTAETMYRGTLRNLGWCDTWKKMVELGLLDEEVSYDLEGLTFRDFLGGLMKSSPESDVKRDLAAYLSIDKDSDVMKRLQWLGLLSETPLPIQKGSALDVLCAQLLEKLQFEENERDMIVLHHEFIVDYPGKKNTITSTLIDYGVSGGDSAMSRTVGLPAAIGAKLVLEGKIKATGVHIPVSPAIYKPVLEELQRQGVTLTEKEEPLKS